MALSRTNQGSWTSAVTYGTGSYTTGSFTPPDNSLLVVVVTRLANATGDLGEPSISGGSLSYTNIGNARTELSWAHRIDAFYAPVTTGASMTITVDDANTVHSWAIAAVAYTGHDTGTPVAGYVTSGTADIGDGSETLTLSATPTADDVTLFAMRLDCDGDDANPSYAAGWAELYGFGKVVGMSECAYLAERVSSTSTSVTVDDTWTAASGGRYWTGMLSWIVKAAAAAVGKPMYAYAQQ